MLSVSIPYSCAYELVSNILTELQQIFSIAIYKRTRLRTPNPTVLLLYSCSPGLLSPVMSNVLNKYVWETQRALGSVTLAQGWF